MLKEAKLKKLSLETDGLLTIFKQNWTVNTVPLPSELKIIVDPLQLLSSKKKMDYL